MSDHLRCRGCLRVHEITFLNADRLCMSCVRQGIVPIIVSRRIDSAGKVESESVTAAIKER